MPRQFEAVFEDRVLKPLEPLSLEENQRVLVAIVDREAAPTVQFNSRQSEQEWLAAHGQDYRGQWAAIDGDALISHGQDGLAVRDEARRKGVERPLIVWVREDFGDPSVGWL